MSKTLLRTKLQSNGGAALPSWLTFTDATQTFSGTPTNSDVGELILKLTYHDASSTNNQYESTFKITVEENLPPQNNLQKVPVIPDTLQGATIISPDYTELFSDPEGDVIIVDLSVSPSAPWLSFDNSNMAIVGTVPSNAAPGDYSITLTGKNEFTSSSDILTSTPVPLSLKVVGNLPPVIVAKNYEVTVPDQMTIDLNNHCTDPEEQPLQFTLNGGAALPSILT